MRGVRAVICTGRLGDLLPLCQQKKVEHLILLTSVGEPHPFLCLVSDCSAAIPALYGPRLVLHSRCPVLAVFLN